jgi:hypothetical protein
MQGSNLKKYEYQWEKESGRCGAGPRTITKRSLGVHTMLCPRCLEESKNSTKQGWYISLLAWFALTVLAFFLAVGSGFDALTTYGSFIILSAIPFMFVAAYYGLRSRPFLSYIGIKSSGYGVRLILKNHNYAAAFRMVNPGMELEINPSFGGHRDILDEGTFMVACCVFGVLLPWVLTVII